MLFFGLSILSAGVQAGPAIKPGARLVTLGDSISEGVLVLNSGPPENWKRERWPDYSDGRRCWAYQSAILVGAEPRTVGFGRLGLTIHGNGGVPPALYSFPYIYDGIPIDESRQPDAVVINLGTNDWNPAVHEVFPNLYKVYLLSIRQHYSNASILCLRPFNGTQASAIEEAVKELDDLKIK